MSKNGLLPLSGLPVLILRFSRMFVSDTGCHEEERKEKEYHHKYGWG
jgi:hypothetical protein